MPYEPLLFPVQVVKGKSYDRGIDRRGPCRANPKPWWTSNTFVQTRGTSQHNAIDIMAPLGAQIVSPVAGRVMETWRYQGEVRPGVGHSDQGGNYARMADDHGNEHFFSHMLRPAAVRPGQRVKAGDLIGYVGQTGNAASTCPHLHYQVRDSSGRPVNPIPKLTPLYEAGGWEASPTRWGMWIGAGVAFTAGVGALWWMFRD